MSDLTGTKGGSGVWQRIISEMPEHDIYIEPFWGRGTIAFKKRPALATIGVDLDNEAIESGRGLATMFKCDAIKWLRGYFHLSEIGSSEPESCVNGHGPESRSPAANFGGFPFRRHLVYLDPPYFGCGHYYKAKVDHEEVIDVFLSLPCPAMLSGYHSDFYAERLGGSRSIQIETVNRAGQRCTEWVWMNFDPPSRYHDVRFVGSGRRERERIKRRVATWSNGLEKMPTAERQAVFEALEKVNEKPPAIRAGSIERPNARGL